MTESVLFLPKLPEPQARWDYPEDPWAVQRIPGKWNENGKVYEFEYRSQNLSAAKRMKTRTETWCQRYVNNKVHEGYEIIIRQVYRQHELYHVVYCRWTDEDKEVTG